MSMEADDKSAAEVAVAPRVTLQDIENALAERYEFTGEQACLSLGMPTGNRALSVLSICILVLKNGYTVVGTSAPASPANFDVALGRKFAYENATRQLWPLMGFCLRDRLAKAAVASPETAEKY